MTDLDSGSFHTVTDPKQAQLLTEPDSKAFFKPFLAREQSATEAAEELGCKLNTVLYRIKTFLEAGLIEVKREQKRKGRTVKYYRSLHDAYFIPFSLTPYATLEERLEAQGAPIFANLISAYANALRQSERFGNYLLRVPDGVVLTTDFVPELTPSGLPVTYSDAVVNLSKDETVKIAEVLRELFQRGVTLSEKPERDDARNQDYFLMVAFMPLPQ